LVAYDHWLYMTDPVSHLRPAHINRFNTISLLNQFDTVINREKHNPA